MDRRGALTVGVGVLMAALLVLAASSGGVAIVRQAPEMPWEHAQLDLSEARRRAEQAGPADAPPPPVEQPPADRLPTWVSVLLVVLLVAGVVVGVIALVRAARTVPGRWRDRVWAGWRRPVITDDHDDPDDAELVAAAVVADAEHERDLLEAGEPRNAIVAAWLRLERAVVSAGVIHRRSDTSTELTERVLSEGSVDPAAIRTLAALYREARFSSHPMGEPERAAAIEALDAVHAGLRPPVPT